MSESQPPKRPSQPGGPGAGGQPSPSSGAFRRQLFGYDTASVDSSLGGLQRSISWLESEVQEQRMLVQQMEDEIAKVAERPAAAPAGGQPEPQVLIASGSGVPKAVGLKRRILPGGYRVKRTNLVIAGINARAEAAERARDDALAACAQLRSQTEAQQVELEVWRSRQGKLDVMYAEAQAQSKKIVDEAHERAATIEREARQQAADIVARAERQSDVVMRTVDELGEISERNRNLESLSRLQGELTAMINESISRFEARLLAP